MACSDGLMLSLEGVEQFGYETWPKDAWTYTGGANNWAGMAVDEARGIVYAPTGSASAASATSSMKDSSAKTLPKPPRVRSAETRSGMSGMK